MKKLLLFICLIYSFRVSAQLSNVLPTIGTYTAFRLNSLPVSVTFPDGYVFPDTVRAEVWQINGTEGLNIASITPSVIISGQNITMQLSAAQVKKLPKTTQLRLIFDKNYILSANVVTTLATGTPSTVPVSVSLPAIGSVEINLIGDPSLAFAAGQTALTATKTSTSAATTATTKAEQAVSAAASIDPKVSVRTPYGTMLKLRAIADTSFKSLIVNDRGREGIFNYSPGSSAADDSALVIKAGSRRYARVYDYIKPEFFGANPNDTLDDQPAMQKALNAASDKGLFLYLSEGTYILKSPLRAKRVNSGYNYKLSIQGRGRGTTTILGKGPGLFGKNMIEIIKQPGEPVPDGSDSFVQISDMTINAGTADCGLRMNKIINITIFNIVFGGGDSYCANIGDESGDNYSVYVYNCYFNTTTFNGGQNISLLKVFAKYAIINNIVGDGSRYPIWCTADQMHISGCTLEGYKLAGIYAKSIGGGLTKIIGNTIRPYSGFDANAIFEGHTHGIYLESQSGGVSKNIINSNSMEIPSVAELDKVLAVHSVNNIVRSDPGIGHKLTGNTSGATAYTHGYNQAESRINASMISGNFANGEIVTQSGSGGTFVLDSVITNHTSGISLRGASGGNIVSSNIIQGNPEWAMIVESENNLINGNEIYTSGGGILIQNHGQITNNFFYTPSSVSVKKTQGDVTFSGNKYNGTLVGIAPQAFDLVTTAQRNAITATYPGIPTGLILYDTTVNKLTRYNGTSWAYLATE